MLRFLPGIPEANLALGTVALLERIRGVKIGTVRVTGAPREQGPALVTFHSPSHCCPSRGGGGNCGGDAGAGGGARGEGHLGSQLCVDVIVADSITEVRGADTGRDTVRLQGGGGTLGLGLDWLVNAAQENTGGETLPDDGALPG